MFLSTTDDGNFSIKGDLMLRTTETTITWVSTNCYSVSDEEILENQELFTYIWERQALFKQI